MDRQEPPLVAPEGLQTPQSFLPSPTSKLVSPMERIQILPVALIHRPIAQPFPRPLPTLIIPALLVLPQRDHLARQTFPRAQRLSSRSSNVRPCFNPSESSRWKPGFHAGSCPVAAPSHRTACTAATLPGAPELAKRLIGVGMAGLAPPLPPNRTGGSPASGSPVSGVSARLTISTGAVFQTQQPLRPKPAVRPPSAVGFAQPLTGPLLPFAQQRPQASPQPSVRSSQAPRVTVPEVAMR